MTTRTIHLEATPHANAHEAIQYRDAAGADRAVMVGGQYLTMSHAEVERLESLGIEFALITWHEPTAHIMTVPVNDR